MSSFRSFLASGGLVAATLLLAVACETAPPVQEMSDARQAIAVAREAGAESLATEELIEAERFLESAEEKLTAERYAEARRDALQAKSRAVAAQRRSEASKTDED